MNTYARLIRPGRLALCLVVVVQCLFLAASACGQIINIEAGRVSKLNDGLKGNVNFGGSYIRNAVDILSLNIGSRLTYKKHRHIGLFIANLQLLQANGNPLAQVGWLHARYAHDTRTPFMPEAFSQIQFNPVQRIDHRLMNGLGTRIKALESDSLPVNLYLGALIVQEYERLTEQAQFQVNRAFRLSSYVNLTVKPTPGANLTLTGYYQPKLDEWSDYRVSMDTRLQFAITTMVGFTFTFHLMYDNAPPPGLQHAFYDLSNQLTFTF
jgi:hypothetical protein